MKQLLHNPYVLFAAYYVATVIIGEMPAPTSNSSTGYVWAYKSLNKIAGNGWQIFARLKGGATPLTVAENMNSMAAGVGQQTSATAKNDPYSDLGR